MARLKCSCGVLVVIAQRKRDDQAMQFLNGIKEQYSNVKSHVLWRNLIPTIVKKIRMSLNKRGNSTKALSRIK